MAMPFVGKLRVRLVVLTLLALLPLGVIALGQAVRSADLNRERIEQSLMDATSIAAVDQSAKINQAIGAGQGLATVVSSMDLDACRTAMAQLLENNPSYAFAGFIRIDGLLECSSSGDFVMDFSNFPSWSVAVERADTFVEVNTDGAVSGKSVMIVNVPVQKAGELIGFVSLSMPQTIVTDAASSLDDHGLALVAVATSGNAFSMTEESIDAEQLLPQGMSFEDLNDRKGSIFYANDFSGDRRAFSVTETVADSFFIVGSWPRSAVFGNDQWKQSLTPVLFAFLMWVASMSVASFGLDRLVLRHLADLRSAMRQFALGERNSDGLTLNNAPNEFKDAERAFNRMALLITEAEAARLTDLHDKEVLLREVHHRVKNNLQMIASIMNLQARAARTDDVRDVLASLQRRVRGLAMLHRSLYTQPETSQVDARDLVSTVISDTSAILPDQELKIETDLHSALLYPDQAVPLSMWVTEALTNAVKYVGRTSDGTAKISVNMHHDGAGEVALEIVNTLGTPLVASGNTIESTGLGAKLMLAFCRQLDGQVETEETDEQYVHVLRFRVQGFDPEAADGVSDDSGTPPNVAA